ncbi:MAG: Lrp/AsnC family transcriptional regulator [Candidatus Thermoplasmatota archaeon]|nr:Lrp/AsnC family transcriptional regulator [Candidatus Thermoplasmatota archaeon]
MAKSSFEQIELDEKRILGELIKNANKSINDIAKSCHFSRLKVWRIINNLEKNHTIWGYTAIVDEEKLGKKTYVMLMKRSNKPTSKEIIDNIINRELPKTLKKFGIEFTHSFLLNGDYDWMLLFNANNVIDAKTVVETFHKIDKGYISDIKLIEKLFTVENCGVINPNINKLNEFFKI